MNNKEFIRYCRDISKSLASDLRYGEFVDAYVMLEEQIYCNKILWQEITNYPGRSHILKEEIAKAFSGCIYSKEATEIVKVLRASEDNFFDDKLREFLEKKLEMLIQKDVLVMNNVGRKRLKTALLREEEYYKYENYVTKKQKENAPSITWQEGLNAINDSIKGARIRARNAQRLALNLPQVDILKYQKFQEDEFLNEYRKFHEETMEIDDRISILATSTRKIEKYVPDKEPFFRRLIKVNKIKAVPVYILEKMGILKLLKLKRDILRAEKKGKSKEEIKEIRKEGTKELGYNETLKQTLKQTKKELLSLRQEAEAALLKIRNESSKTRVIINEEHNVFVTYNDTDKVKNLTQISKVDIQNKKEDKDNKEEKNLC